MNLIIVGRRQCRKWTLDRERPLTLVLPCLCLLVTFAIPAALGFLVGQWLKDPRQPVLADLAALRSNLEVQQRELDRARDASEQHMNALALQLAELQAQATRLNALGERLTRMGRLDDGEFNFRELPAVGGPEELPAAGGFTDGNFNEAIEQMRRTFSAQAQQLALLESLLMDRELDRSLQPAGMPVRTGYISSPFGYRTDPFTGRRTMHSGVDFSAPRGTEVLAVAGGVVTFSGRRPGYGKIVEIDHGNGFQTRYAHNSEHKVELGDRVHAGQPIAKVGSTGRASGVHVHFEVWHNGRPVNPMEFIRTIREEG